MEDNHHDDHNFLGGWDQNPEDEEHEGDNVNESGGDGQDTNDIKQVEEDTGAGRRRRRSRRSMIQVLPSAGLNGPYWHQMSSLVCPILAAMVVAKQAGIRMMKEYFEIEASKSTPQYGFRKGLKLFGDKGYQAAKNKVEVNLHERGCINMLS